MRTQLGWALIYPIYLAIQLGHHFHDRAARAHNAWRAELAAYLEAGWEWDGGDLDDE